MLRLASILRATAVVPIAGCVALAIISSSARAAEGDFSLREETATTTGQQKAMVAEADAGHTDDAASRLDVLIREHGADLRAVDGGLLCVAQSLEAFARTHAGIVDSYRKQFDPAARQRLDNVNANPKSTAADFYAVARQYPLSTVAGEALAGAADREARGGDWQGASDLYAAATSTGWEPGPEAASQLASLSAAMSAGAAAYSGPIPFDASWYERGTGLTRSFPIAAGDLVLVPGVRQVVAFGADGNLAWISAPGPDGRQPQTEELIGNGMGRGFGRGRRGFGGLFGGGGRGGMQNYVGPPPQSGYGNDNGGGDAAVRMSVLAPAGAASIIVVRENGADADGNGFCLAGLRASDGTRIWCTRATPELGGTSFGRSPVVDGRYVYAVAVDLAKSMGSVKVVALDVTSGKPIWQTPVGAISPMISGRGKSLMESVETLSFDSAIAVHGRTLVLTPDLGAALDLDRFDGQLNWERTVTMDAEVVGDQKVSVYQKRFQGQPFIAGGVAIVAPLANSQVQALSLETGAAIWHLSDLGDATLIGGIEANAAAGPTTKPANSAAPSIAILSGAAVAGLDINTGQAVWGWQPSPGSSISGPAVVNGSLVHVPVEGKIITLSAVTGTSASPGGAVPTMAPALKNGSALSALTQAGVVSSFDRSAAPGN